MSNFQEPGQRPPAVPGNPAVEDTSLGHLVSDLTTDLSALMRQELGLAKAELRQEAKKGGKAAGLLGGAGVATWMVLLFASLTAMWALAEAMDVVWAALIVTALWAIVAAVLGLTGRRRLQELDPKPGLTVQSLKEDKEWLSHPKS